MLRKFDEIMNLAISRHHVYIITAIDMKTDGQDAVAMLLAMAAM